LKTLLHLETLPFDIFLRLSSGKTLQIGRKGQSVLQENLKRYQEKGLESVLVKPDELQSYKDSKEIILNSRSAPPQLIALMGQSRKIYEGLEVVGFQPSDLAEAEVVAQKASQFLADHQDLISILEKLKFFNDPIASHSLAVGTTAVMIAKIQGWLHPSNFQKLFLGGLLHDIGMMMLPDPIRMKSVDQMDERELTSYKTHPVLGFKSLVRVSGTPKEVLSIVLEHHEGRDTGYPKGLKDDEIHPMARLIALADHFTDYVLGPVQAPGTNTLAVNEALKLLSDNEEGTFKREDIISLEKLLKT
jgi:putative nucleotidyltransferase with HDIG domain